MTLLLSNWGNRGTECRTGTNQVIRILRCVWSIIRTCAPNAEYNFNTLVFFDFLCSTITCKTPAEGELIEVQVVTPVLGRTVMRVRARSQRTPNIKPIFRVVRKLTKFPSENIPAGCASYFLTPRVLKSKSSSFLHATATSEAALNAIPPVSMITNCWFVGFLCPVLSLCPVRLTSHLLCQFSIIPQVFLLFLPNLTLDREDLSMICRNDGFVGLNRRQFPAFLGLSDSPSRNFATIRTILLLSLLLKPGHTPRKKGSNVVPKALPS